MTRLNYRHNQRDANEQPLITLALQLGCPWIECEPLDGKVWIPRRGMWSPPIEIKLPEREGLVHEYTRAQKKFFTWCQQYNAPWWVWRTEFDVERDLGATR